MKKIIKVEVELDDAYIKDYSIEENFIMKYIGSQIEDFLSVNLEGILSCNTYVDTSDNT